MRTFLRIAPLALLVIAMCFTAKASAALSVDTDVTTQFDAANKLYEQGKFPDATKAYEAILQKGVASPALYFNLGNARFKSARIGSALAAYRQAERLAPRDPDVRANLQFARNQVQGPTLPAGRIERWLAKLTLNEWTALTVGALWLTCFLLMVNQLRPKLALTLRSSIIAAGCTTVILAACLGFAITNHKGTNVAIVTVREATVHNGPFDDSPGAFTAHDGAELHILDRKDEWLQVTGDNRRIGWLKRSDVTLLTNS